MSTSQASKQTFLEAVMKAAPVIPVVIVDDPKKAVIMARALVAGGLPAIEVTLRTQRALECLAAIATEVERRRSCSTPPTTARYHCCPARRRPAR
jgi:2-dehydro-3-deoxyphosphogluconate aldolase/(4S)-4-hydroxy-2-oxoglutarate aldolase